MNCKTPLFRLERDRIITDLKALSAYDRAFGSRSSVIVSSVDLEKKYKFYPFHKVQRISCGQCISCRLNKAKEWAIRCCHEASLYDHNYFVTLTYDDCFLPCGEWIKNPSTGEVTNTSLRPKDVSDFIKRLRSRCERRFNHKGIRVAYCGEYGTELDRPHYHLLLFNMPDLSQGDLSFWKHTDGYDIFRSKLIEDCWTFNPARSSSGVSLGFSTVTEFSFQTAAYVASYSTKKLTGLALKLDPSVDVPLRVQPFFRTSNRPGIGKPYIDTRLDQTYTSDKVFYQKDYDVYQSKPPRYYDKIFDLAHGGNIERWKDYTIGSEFVSEDDGQLCLDLQQHSRSMITHGQAFKDLKSSRDNTSEAIFGTQLSLFGSIEEKANNDAKILENRKKRRSRDLS